MKILNYKTDKEEIIELISPQAMIASEYDQRVLMILREIRARGDKALKEFTLNYDGVNLEEIGIRVSDKLLKESWELLPQKKKDALKIARDRIEAFHRLQLPEKFVIETKESGIHIKERTFPISSVGVYVPGAKADYPSSVLMNIIPAQVAGVESIVMVTPPERSNPRHSSRLAAAHMLGLKEVYQIGGAQAIAALAFGTETIPKVDKIVGPGNIFVATAKKLLFGIIAIDSFAGPSEIMIIADKTANPAFLAADLLSQAEHDELASPILVLIGKYPVNNVIKELNRILMGLERKDIVFSSIEENCIIIQVDTPEEAIEVTNIKAPEHLEIITEKPEKIERGIHNAGAIFMGEYTPVAFGDYIAGPNHTLPTGGTARFFSPLSVRDFLKHDHCIKFSKQAYLKYRDAVIELANLEGFGGHALSVQIRDGK